MIISFFGVLWKGVLGILVVLILFTFLALVAAAPAADAAAVLFLATLVYVIVGALIADYGKYEITWSAKGHGGNPKKIERQYTFYLLGLTLVYGFFWIAALISFL